MLIEQIRLRKLLSFNDATITLGPLNILIGENAAGKSNLIEAISLLQAAPSDLGAAVLRGGGIRFWLWLGDGMPAPIGILECHAGGTTYRLEFSEDVGGMVILDEKLSGSSGEVYFNRVGQSLNVEGTHGYPIGRTESVFAQFKNPADKTPITHLGQRFEKVRIYREFQTGPRASSRHGVAANQRGDYLDEAGSNLALVLQELDFHGVHDRVREFLKRFSGRMNDVKIRFDQGIARAFLHERGLLQPLPSARMSDGTLKFLCLLAVLLHPDPPPLVCIEEPEQGLHPDAIRIVAEALRDASNRMQLIVTTHSRELIDAFSDEPESVLVCERDFDEGTQCRRLSHKQLDEWLESYTLGELWAKGEIGGTRW